MTDRDRLIELIKQATTSHLDYLESIGKSVFLTKAEAEKALAQRSKK